MPTCRLPPPAWQSHAPLLPTHKIPPLRNERPPARLGAQPSPTCGASAHSSWPALSRRSILRLLLTAPPLLALNAQRAGAVCGDPDPAFTHFIDWKEDMTRAPDGRLIHYRCVGSRTKEQKARKLPVLYIGDAGVSMSPGEPLELLAGTDRRVVFVDLLGMGESQPVEGMLELDRASAVAIAKEEVQAVLEEVGVSRPGKEAQALHIVAVGFGLGVAEALVRGWGKGDSCNVRVASVAAEGWGPVRGEKGGVTFEALQGSRVCAAEGAEDGELSVVEMLYGDNTPKSTYASALRSISELVPTLALRTQGEANVSSGRAPGLLEEKEVKQAGRVAHLEASEDTLEILDRFFSRVESELAKPR